MDSCIKLKSLNIDELMGVVNLYPWFGNARKELCMRLTMMGDKESAASALSEAALYVSSRKVLSDIHRGQERHDCTDKDLDMIIKSYIAGDSPSGGQEKDGQRQVYVVGGDYFSQKQYDAVKCADDMALSGIGRHAESGAHADGQPVEDTLEFYTEPLAQIYAEQGYPEQARKIYAKLILAYPEKNAYFAALIEKLNQEIKNH